MYSHLKSTSGDLTETHLVDSVEHEVVASVRFDANANFIQVNDAFCLLTGYSRKQVLATNIADITNHFLYEQLLDIQNRGESSRIETTLNCKNGSSIQVEILCQPISLDSNQHFAAIVLDISDRIIDRKAREKQLRISQLGIDKSVDAVFWIQRDGSFSYVNEAACQNLGHSESELLQMKVADISLASPNSEAWTTHWNLVKKHGTATIDSQHKRKDGSTYDCEIRASYLNFEQDEILNVIVRDVTEQKRSQARLRQQSLSLDRASAAIIWAELDTGIVIDANETHCARLGYRKEELIGKTIYDFDQSAGNEQFELFKKQLKDCGRAKFESIHTCKNGTNIPVEITVTLHDFDGDQLICCFARDITEQQRDKKETAQRLAELSSQLAHLNRVSSMGEMASAIAHELNQPLSAISTNAFLLEELLDSNSTTSADLRSLAKKIREQAIMSGEIVHRLRGFVSGKSRTREIADINDVVTESLKLMDTRIRHENIEQRYFLAPTLPKANVDRIQVQQVIVNLLLNAVEAIDTDSVRRRITVRTSAPEYNLVQVQIEDTGKGIPKGTGSSCFNPFFTTKPDGMGMGLAISRSIVEGHGGAIKCSSDDFGTEFRVRFPTGLL